MSYLQKETSNLDVKEQVGFLFKAALGFPTTKETTPYFMETSVPPNNYIFASDIASDPVPSEVFSGTSKDVTTIGLTASDFCAGGGIKENADGTVREYTFLILDEIPNSNQQGWYKKNNEGKNQLADALQFNTNAGAANWYNYGIYSENNTTASGKITSPNGGNWMFDVKNGVIFVPDSTSSFNNTNNKPVLSFYKYIGNKGISGGGGGGGGSSNTPSNVTLNGQPLEIISGICDGRTVIGESGTYTLPNVTAGQYFDDSATSYVEVTGSSIAYKPPANTKQIIYKFRCHVSGIAENYTNSSSYVIGVKAFLDGTELETRSVQGTGLGDGSFTCSLL